jgi:hypothetical protein
MWCAWKLTALCFHLSFADAGIFCSKTSFNSKSVDVNLSDLDLCEFNGQTVMFFVWGQQHYDNGVAIAVSDMPLANFLPSWFP